MATYYRWRKSTIGVQYDEETRGPDTRPVQFVLEKDVGSVYYQAKGSGYTYNGDGTVTLPSASRSSLSGGWSTGYTMYTAESNPASELFFALAPYDIYWKKTGFGETLIYGFRGSDSTIVNCTRRYNFRNGPGTSQGYVYSTSSSAYPNGGASGDYWYDQRTTVTSPTAPSGLTYPNPITTPTVTVSWNAAGSNTNYPVNLYEVSYSTNNGSSWTVAGTTASTSMSVSIPAGATSIQFRVRARDSNNQWGSYVTGTASTVILAPTLTVPQMVMQGQQASISWTEVEGADNYTVQRKSSADADWTQVYSGSATTFSETVGTWTSLQYRVQAVFGETSGGWATSASIPVVSASALVISGSDGDLGTLTADVVYSISTDTGNPITATITVNGAVIFSGSVGNSASDVIPVLDLASGTGTIVIEASVQAASGSVSAARTWTYTKAPITFPNAGGVAQLTQEGANIWPKTLAECVRLPGGRTLDVGMLRVEIGWYQGTNTYGASNPTSISFSGKPYLVFITGGAFNSLINPLVRRSNSNATSAATFATSSSNIQSISATWGDNSVSWYSTSSAQGQLNGNGAYHYLALLLGGDE